MARTNLPVTNSTRAGVAPPAEVNGDVANGHSFVNDGKTLLIVRNAGGAPYNVIIQFGNQIDGQDVTPRTVAVPAAETRYFGPFSQSLYGTVVEVDVDSGSGTNLKLSTLSVS